MPHANVGVATGEISGIWIMDVDVRPEKDGEETLRELVNGHDDLPDTLEQITGSGGRHLVFRLNGVKIRNSAGNRLGTGLDTRGDGGYFAAPPSRHASGRRYEWEASSDPFEGGRLSGAPAWLSGLVGTSAGVDLTGVPMMPT